MFRDQTTCPPVAKDWCYEVDRQIARHTVSLDAIILQKCSKLLQLEIRVLGISYIGGNNYRYMMLRILLCYNRVKRYHWKGGREV